MARAKITAPELKLSAIITPKDGAEDPQTLDLASADNVAGRTSSRPKSAKERRIGQTLRLSPRMHDALQRVASKQSRNLEKGRVAMHDVVVTAIRFYLAHEHGINLPEEPKQD